jgi:hypothetical protein
MEVEHFVRLTFNIAESFNEKRTNEMDLLLLKILQGQGVPISIDPRKGFHVKDGAFYEGKKMDGRPYFEVRWKPLLDGILNFNFGQEQPTLEQKSTIGQERTIKDVTPTLEDTCSALPPTKRKTGNFSKHLKNASNTNSS